MRTTSEITITIRDSNDEIPEFSQKSYFFLTSSSGTLVVDENTRFIRVKIGRQ